jgi:hypothetical protein
MRYSILISLALICVISSAKISQIFPIIEPAENITERNITRGPRNITEREPLRPPRNITEREPLRPPRNITERETPIGAEETRPSIAEGNVTTNFFEPPFIPSGFFTERLRVIPPQFWVNRDSIFAIVLRKKDGKSALVCKEDGSVSIEKYSEENKSLLFFPELVSENIVRLRSYHGGYLNFDTKKKSLSCDSRRQDFLSRFTVFLNRDPKTQCLFVAWHNFLLGYTEKDLLIETFKDNINKYCWIGDPKNLSAWRGANTYTYSFEPSIFSVTPSVRGEAPRPSRPSRPSGGF